MALWEKMGKIPHGYMNPEYEYIYMNIYKYIKDHGNRTG
jgi:hypothetical protein